MSSIIKKITKADQKIALSSVESLSKCESDVLRNGKKTVQLRIQESEELITIPLQAFLLFKSILKNMAEGKSVTLISSDSEISTQEAADILNVSRPHIVKLLESGIIPFKKVGSHRRVQLKDILSYESNLKADRRKQLDLLAREAQDLNMGYE